MNRYVAVFRDEAGPAQSPRDRAPAQGGGADRLHRRSRHGLQPGRARSDRARLHARLRRGHRRWRRIERKESRGAQFRTDFPERNDDEWLKHIDISRNGDDTPQISYSPVTFTPVAARGAQVLDEESLMTAGNRVHAAHPALRPRVGRRALLGRAHDRARAAPLGAGGHPAGQGALRRLDRHPLLVQARRSAAPAACASTASPAWPATRTWTTRWPPPRTGSSRSSRWATCP